MNNIFSFDRFLKVLKFDLKMRVPAIATTFLVFLLLPHVLHWIMSSEYAFFVNARVELYGVMIGLLMFFAPFTIYSGLREKQGKSGFLMLPASALEKFASMVTVSLLLVPGAFLLCTFLLDSVLVLLFREYYISFVTVDFMVLLRGALTGFSVVGAALLGNAVFKGKASFKTILCLLVLAFLWGAVVTDFILMKVSQQDAVGDIAVIGDEQFAQLTNITAIVIFAVGVLSYCLTYWRIKKIQIS